MDPNLLDKVTQEDRIQAAEIRDHYSKKIMMLLLRGVTLTPFRKRLNQYLNLPSLNQVEPDMLPIISKLPVFYEYDIGFEQVRMSLVSVTPDDLRFGLFAPKTEFDLEPVKHFSVKLKSQKYDEYWLKDKDNRGYKIKLPGISPKNPLLHLWEREFAKPRIKISGTRTTLSVDTFYYHLLNNWELIAT